MTFRRGDIVLMLFPDSNLRSAKRRPALIVQADDLGAGLLMDSVVMTDNLATVLHSEIDRVIGTVGEVTQVDRALRTTLGL
jgi:mRNA interferase MazF